MDFPPLYDDDLNLKFVRFLKYTPLIFFPSFISIDIFLSLQRSDPSFWGYFLNTVRYYLGTVHEKATFGILTSLLLLLLIFDAVRFCIKERL